MRAWLRIPLQVVTLGLLVALALVAVVTGAYYYSEPSLPSATELRQASSSLQIPLNVYSRDGRLMQQYGEQLRTPADFDEIPLILRQGVIAAEDDQFYQHSGIDLLSTIRAVFNYTISTVIGSNERVPGASTITQQIARTTNLLDRDYALGRKIKEIFLAFRIEEEFTKDEILRLYLNTYFFGQRSYGVVSAARTYFNKSLADLTLSEVAIIAGIPTAPSRNNPYTSPENAASRRRYVLRRMFELGYITAAEREAALAEPIVSELHDIELELSASYVADMAYQWCQRRFGKAACDTSGLTITTTIDSRLQRAANAALTRTLEAYDQNHGYRGPIARIDPETLPEDPAELQEVLDELLGDYPNQFDSEAAVVVAVDDMLADVYMRSAGFVSIGVDAVSWAGQYVTDDRRAANPTVVGDALATGDIVRFRRLADGAFELYQQPDVEGALVSVDPMDGAIVSLVGGYSFDLSNFNRATMALRQPGSAFKPFFYLSALADGYTLASIIMDAPDVYDDPGLEETRYVSNYDGRYHGEVSLRFALTNSLNTVADRIVRDILPRNSIPFLRRFGFSEDALPPNASLALGSGSLTPAELAGAYAILANGGYAVGIRSDATAAPAPYFIDRVENADGKLLYDAGLSVEMVCPEPDPAEAGSGDEGLIARKGELFPPLRCAERVESPQRIYLITDVLKDVVRVGSGARAGRAFPRRTDLAGKTGTTTDARDAWFAGFNADIVAVVRVGFDDDSRGLGAGEQGGRTAIPAWIDFMSEALDGMPEHSLPRPPGIVDRRVTEKGQIAADCNQNFRWESFLPEDELEREPESVCRQTSPLFPVSPDESGDNGELFR